MRDDFDRRAFIRRTSTGAAAIGVATVAGGSIFGQTANAATRKSQADHHHEAPEVLDGSDVVAHVVNARTGEMSILVGTKELKLMNRDLAQQIVRAGH